MQDQITVTNLRIRRSELVQIKAKAAELGLSVNEFINRLLRLKTTQQELYTLKESTQKNPIWDLSLLSARRQKSKPKELSSEDELIYGDARTK